MAAAPASFDIAPIDASGVVVVTVHGDLDVYSAPELRDRLDPILGEELRELVVDVSGLTFIDSTGIGVIVGAMKRIRDHGGDLVLRSPSRATMRVLEITQLTDVVRVEQS